ncbi:MAG: hypothetical protein B6U94_05590 [Thermofilum sp. ex4484_79]|nr:MAG: hypothetical protein B6U94_05590 [Thermofilum sp. ex4484_79]
MQVRIKGSVVVYVAVDNYRHNRIFLSAHGLSVLVNINNENRILFNLGPSFEILKKNLSLFETNIKDIDFIIISNLRKAFTGGFKVIHSPFHEIKVITPPESKFSLMESIGLSNNIRKVEKKLELLPGVLVSPPIGNYDKEIAVIIRHEKGDIILLGCSHTGSIEILTKLRDMKLISRPICVIGGLHLSGENEIEVSELIGLLREMKIKYVIPLYCTGIKARLVILKSLNLPTNLHGAGLIWRI